MAFKKPTVNTIKPDIKNLSIYLRSTKKFGKTTLFRDVILAKYGDPERGLLVKCGNEDGDNILDEINSTSVSSYDDMVELLKWLIDEKGKEHNIEIVAFDTVDELCLLTDKEAIRQSNKENPTKKIKSIRAAFGGFTAGEKYSANDLIKPYMNKLKKAGFGVWAIAHTKFKNIKEKGGLEEDGYMQLTSNMSADYESAFGDVFDVTLTGVIDRGLQSKGDGDKKKNYSTGSVRKLYFRETPLIDAGGRFAFGAVPEYMVFDKPDMGADFVRVVEEGMMKSKKNIVRNIQSEESITETKNIITAVVPDNVAEDLDIEVDDDIDDNILSPESDDLFDEVDEEDDAFEYPEDLRAEIRTAFREAEADLKNEIKAMLSEEGVKLNDCPDDMAKQIYRMLKNS